MAKATSQTIIGKARRLDLYELTHDELCAYLSERGQARYRADQIFAWAHRSLAASFEEMTDLPLALREELNAAFSLGPTVPLGIESSRDAAKLLLPLDDGEAVECVRMHTGQRSAALCLSSQVGCAIQCTFCASGAGGLVRNLTAGEIVRQAITLRALVGPARNVVFMGMGEPLHSLAAVMKAISILTDKRGWGISPQRITVATSGVAQGIRRYAQEGPRTELAVSLNATDDDVRRQLMPGAKDTIADILAACDEFSAHRSGQPITYTYVLLRGINDRPEDVLALARLLKGRRHHVNLIIYNPVNGLPYVPPRKREAVAFLRRLDKAGLNVSLRRSRGRSINAACGQLRARVRRDEAQH